MNDLFDFWRLCDELSVNQAADLIIGMPPGQEHEMRMEGAEMSLGSRVEYRTNFYAARTSLENAVLGGRLRGTLRRDVHSSWDSISECMVETESEEVNWDRTTVLVEDLKAWLRGRGFSTGFFFPPESVVPPADYLDPAGERYAPKLAAAVSAWQAVADPAGKTPKQALIKWLREHAAEFQLSDDEGKPNELGIEECAKVANWETRGGPAKTPGG